MFICYYANAHLKTMRFLNVKADNFRNFSNLSLEFNPRFNLFFGENGTGKTSLLEMLYFLSYGKSFRTNFHKRLIRDENTNFTLFSKIISEYQSPLSIGVDKNIKGEGEFKLAGAKVHLTEITELLPIQILNSDGFLLLTNGPIARRQFLDWGLFHVKHSFLSTWRDYQRAIKQRNISIKQRASLNEITTWDRSITIAAEKLAVFRKQYVELFIEAFLPILKPIFDFDQLSINFYQGWPMDVELEELLQKNIHKDLQLGYTYYGAHRADLKITIKGKAVVDVLSRGQQKIFVWLMKLSQALILNRLTKKAPIILIDDLSSELDGTRLNAISDLLNTIEGQIFITAINKVDLEFLISSNKEPYQLFHVEHDQVRVAAD